MRQRQAQRRIQQRAARIDQRRCVAVPDQELVGLHAVVAAYEVVEGDADVVAAAEQFCSHCKSCKYGKRSIFAPAAAPSLVPGQCWTPFR
jgi:uncharacterized Fe-S cluster protein YjdI